MRSCHFEFYSPLSRPVDSAFPSPPVLVIILKLQDSRHTRDAGASEAAARFAEVSPWALAETDREIGFFLVFHGLFIDFFRIKKSLFYLFPVFFIIFYLLVDARDVSKVILGSFSRIFEISKFSKSGF